MQVGWFEGVWIFCLLVLVIITMVIMVMLIITFVKMTIMRTIEHIRVCSSVINVTPMNILIIIIIIQII